MSGETDANKMDELIERCCAAADSMQPAASVMIKGLAALLKESLERSQCYHEDRIKILEEHVKLQKQHIDLWQRYLDLQNERAPRNDEWIRAKLAELPVDKSRPN
jgi:hypothetical protein